MKQAVTKYDAKIEQLTNVYRDKQRSRTERHDAFRELTRVKYQVDPRPSVSVRKQAIYEAVMFLAETVFFGFQVFVDREVRHGSPLDTIFSVVIIAIFVALITLSVKYKKEPDDELSLRIKQNASRYAAITLYIILGVTALVCFDFLGMTFTLYEFNWIGTLMMSVCLYAAISRIMFLILEGREAGEE